MKTLIVSNGTVDDMTFFEEIVSSVDYVICADGGARYLYQTGIKPDVIVGDLDSLDECIVNDMKNRGTEFIEFPVKKDKTDTELAIDYAVEKGATDITLMGATGTRLDHTIGNIMIMRQLLDRGIGIRILDSHNEIYMINDTLTLDKKDNTYVSVIPITEVAKGITLEGFKYETYDLDFYASTTLGISNEIIKEKGTIKIRDGICLVVRSKD